ncbi:MAG TPA: lactate racemase domain-containing protein [Terriglobales bacterium]|nr:lactate racemase domain-containing protein [Terriglobales bacterium]
MTLGVGSSNAYLDERAVRDIVAAAVNAIPVQGKRVLIIIPDGTRTAPIPQMFRYFQELLRPQVKALDYLVALGTHPPMSDAQLSKLVGVAVHGGRAGETRIFNHQWSDRATFATLGNIPAHDISVLTNGLMRQDVPVTINKLIFEYDHLIVCGPVFPHEVVGFSGGNKYFFPGIAGPEIINFTHWLGAVITNYEVIGAGSTPVRAVIDKAASLIPKPTWCFALVVDREGISGLYFDKPAEAWKAASALSARKHIDYVDKPFRRVLSILPELYDDLWTGAKGMYKLEPAILDGGEVVIYSPRITEVSYTHGRLIEEVGYHCRDYFLKQWDRFQHYPGGVLAHSTHVKGLGTYEVATGTEKPRISVTLATGIPEERCRRINLGYLDPASVRLEDWSGREHEGVRVIPNAGERLYRINGSSALPAK